MNRGRAMLRRRGAATSRTLLPDAPLTRGRLLLLVLAVANIAMVAPELWSAAGAGGLSVAILLAAHWIAGYRRGSFPLLAEPLEAAAIFVILRVVPGEPFLPLFGLAFRTLYGGVAVSGLRYGLWVGALLGAHAPRGGEHLQADVARAVGLGLVPMALQSLRAALQRLEGSERRLRSLIANSTDVLTVVGADLVVRWQADSIRRALGHDPRDVLGTSFEQLVHPDDRPMLAGAFAQPARRPRELTVRLRHRDGSQRSFEIAVSNCLEDPNVGGYVLNMRDVSDREQLALERRALHEQRNRDEAARLEVERLQVRVEAQRERQELERQLQHRERMESVGQLAGGIAHDFNNMLAAILNYAGLIREELDPDCRAQADLAEIEEVSRRGARLVRQLLMFSQGEAGEAELLDLNAVIRDMHSLMTHSLGHHVELRRQLEPELWPVEADLSNLEQVLVNLLVNARDAIGESGTVTVATANAEITSERAADLDLTGGRYVRLTVSDDGSGMDERTMARALEPFFTTKPVGEGTGLGLATVFGIASQAGGTVTLHSRVSEGTTFDVYLPAARPEAART